MNHPSTKTTVVDQRFDNAIHQGMHVLARLQAAGIPVIGVIWPEGVESGTLTVEAVDIVDGTTRYRWSP